MISTRKHLSSWHDGPLESRKEWILLAVLFLISVTVRALVLVLFEEAGGDGPTRAQIAYLWSQDPSIQTYGVWPPGFMYLSGTFSLILPDPFVSTRILNVILGSLTVPFLYLLVVKVYEHRTALLSAGILALFPLHVALSSTSLSEVSVVFEIIAGVWFLIRGSDSTGRHKVFFLGLSMALLSIATMTRYEAWLVIPFAAGYYFWKTRNKTESLVLLAVLVTFPITWLAGNVAHTGALLPNYAAAIELDTVDRTFGQTVYLLAKLSRNYLGWFVLLAGAVGLVMRFFRGFKGRWHAEEVLYLGILCSSALFLLKFSMGRTTPDLMGHGRYFLLIYTLLLPLSVITFQRFAFNTWYLAGLIYVLLVGSMFAGSIMHKPRMELARQHPEEIRGFVDWIENSAYSDGNVLVTSYRNSSLLWLYDPKRRYLPVAHKLPLLEAMLKVRRPTLFIVRKEMASDAKHKQLVEELLATKLDSEKLVHTIGTWNVFNLAGLINEEPSPEENTLLRVIDYTGGLFYPEDVREILGQ